MAQSELLRIGTRGSPLALYQARAVRDRLAAASRRGPESIEIKVIRTSGDVVTDRPLADEGGKGLFTKEIEEALLAGTIDLAVHSAKDVPTVLPGGLKLTACLPREDARDAFISAKANSLKELPHGATVGTSSPRRQAIVKRIRPDLKIVALRGNVGTRLRKLEDGIADATILALAGLKRLGLEQHATEIMAVEEFLPAVGQGAIAIETRTDDGSTNALVAAIDDDATSTALRAERAFLAHLDGSCRSPIAGHATLGSDILHFRGLILSPDGSVAHETAVAGSRRDATTIGSDAGWALWQRAGADFFR